MTRCAPAHRQKQIINIKEQMAKAQANVEE
jgi:hypothetical protein